MYADDAADDDAKDDVPPPPLMPPAKDADAAADKHAERRQMMPPMPCRQRCHDAAAADDVLTPHINISLILSLYYHFTIYY